MRCTALDCPRPAGAPSALDPLLSRLCASHRSAVTRYSDRAAALERLVRTGSASLPGATVQQPEPGALCTRCGLLPQGTVTTRTVPGRETLCASCRDHAGRRPATPAGGGRRLRVTTLRPPRSKREAGAVLTTRDETSAEIALYERPRTRGDCLTGCNSARPCPWVSCKHHLYLDVNEVNGSIKLSHPGLPVEALAESCALDVADRGEQHLEAVGGLLNLTRERVRQMESKALSHALPAALALGDYLNSDPPALPERRHTRTGSVAPSAAHVEPDRAGELEAVLAVRHAHAKWNTAMHARLIASGWRPVTRGSASGYYRHPDVSGYRTIYEAASMVPHQERRAMIAAAAARHARRAA